MRRLYAVALSAAVVAVAAAADPETAHVVQPGESLSQIAARVLGDPACWPEIYRANRDQIADPSVLHPGQRLLIPEELKCTSTEPAAAQED